MADSNDKPLGRYIRVLETVARAKTGVTLTEIARELDLQPGTAHRLIRGLADLDLLRSAPGTKSYLIGPRLQTLLHTTMDRAGYAGLAKSVLDGLVAEFGETAHLARLNGDFAESVLMEQPSGSDRAFVQPGRQLPLHAAASGKAILAFQDEAFVARYLSRPRPRFTDKTKVEEADILDELAQIRADGVAVCDNELDAGVLSYGHPIRVNGGYVLYSVGITGLADRFRPMEPTRIKQKLAEAAADLGRRLGFTA